MCLIGLVAFMPVNIQLVWQGNDGCFCCGVIAPPPSFPGNMTCPMGLQGATIPHSLQLFKGHLQSKALFLEKVGGSLEMSLVFKYFECFHVQRSHQPLFIAIEIHGHNYHRLPTDPEILFSLQPPTQAYLKFVKNWLTSHNMAYIHPWKNSGQNLRNIFKCYVIWC